MHSQQTAWDRLWNVVDARPALIDQIEVEANRTGQTSLMASPAIPPTFRQVDRSASEVLLAAVLALGTTG